MSKLSNAIYEIHEMDELAARKLQVNELHPLVKLIVTIVFITCVVSADKYNLFELLPFMIYPLMIFNLADISIKSCFKKLRIVLPLICFVGIWNPFIDRIPMVHCFGFIITGGMVSMVTLMLKGTMALMASFLFIATTGIEGICYALQLLHVPSILVTQILLTYRYITVLLGEANAVSQAYSLRAPREKGVKYKVWGSLIGQLLFRSIDRAESLYDSMILRGFQGKFYYNKQKCGKADYVYLFLWIGVIISLKLVSFIL